MQPSLFTHRPVHRTPYQPTSETSKAAAVTARTVAGQQAEQVYAYVLGCGARGASQKEICAGLFLGRPSVAARVNALWRAGRLVKTTVRRQACAVYTSDVWAVYGD